LRGGVLRGVRVAAAAGGSGCTSCGGVGGVSCPITGHVGTGIAPSQKLHTERLVLTMCSQLRACQAATCSTPHGPCQAGGSVAVGLSWRGSHHEFQCHIMIVLR
jgi:hypothetical protein